MNSVTPNPLLGVGFHSVGAAFAANCYSPQKYIKRWSWEIYWIVQASWCWLLWPLIGAWLTIPHLGAVLSQSPHGAMWFSFLLGVAYGVGGMAFNVSIRYIGFALTYSIAVGLSSILGTLVPPLVHGQVHEILSRVGSGWIIGGVVAGAAGIAICGIAGHFKEGDLDARQGTHKGFSLAKGLSLSLLAGVLSAVYGFALDAANPIVDVAEQHGAGIWKGNVAYMFSNTGAFLTSLVYCLWLMRRHKSAGEFTQLKSGESGGSLTRNYLLAFLTGTLWYGQFFFYNLGHVRLGKDYAFSSWAIHMIMLVLISNIVGIIFKEWRSCRGRTRMTIGFGLVVLCAAVIFLTYGNYLGEPR
ncbi:MAG TPA: L-rhamnose/proton symporter RhaT [Verrucomicrobiae bacterium]|nr:L-rhamnose/proton symporter RhaT [Verrucomicrobiae bacterium]